MDEFLSIAADVRLGKNVKLAKFLNLYGCRIGDNTKIGALLRFKRMRPLAITARYPVIHSYAKG